MEQKQFAKGIFITEKQSKAGKTYLDISISENGTYKKYVAFKGTKEAKYGGLMYSVYDKTESEKQPVNEPKNEDLPF
jgi:hypothetical protein